MGLGTGKVGGQDRKTGEGVKDWKCYRTWTKQESQVRDLNGEQLVALIKLWGWVILVERYRI